MLDVEDYQWIKGTLKKLDFFGHCSDENVMEIAESMEHSHYKAGQKILMQGEFSDRLYLIKSGTVDILKKVGEDHKKVAELGTEKYFGEISLLTPSSATATVKAKTATGSFKINAVAVAGGDTSSAIAIIGASTIEGAAPAKATVRA